MLLLRYAQANWIFDGMFQLDRIQSFSFKNTLLHVLHVLTRS